MGTTMSYYIIHKEGSSQEPIKASLKTLGAKRKPFVAYSVTADWFAFYEEAICEGYFPGKRDIDALVEAFSADVIAFSLFDSDILYLSYCRFRDKAIFYHAKPNDEEFEEYDPDMYDLSFPEFLASFCSEDDREKLVEIWESEDYDFSDDRLKDICRLIGAPVVNHPTMLPSGYERIDP